MLDRNARCRVNWRSRAGGRVLVGLTRRRKAEGLMFAGDVKGALALAHS